MISIELNDEPDSEWNKRLLESKLGTIYQTKEYASFTKIALGWNSFFLKFLNVNGKIVGQLMLSVYPRFDGKNKIDKILKIIPNLKNLVFRWVSGPIIFDSNYNEKIYETFRDFLLSKKCRVIGYEHPLSNSIFLTHTKPFQVKKMGTFIIDLSENTEVLWKKLEKNSARKNIQRSQDRRVQVQEMSRTDLSVYQKMLDKTKQKVGSHVPLSVLEALWDTLRPIGFTGFLAYKEQVAVGGIMVSSFNKYINEWGISRSEKDTNEKLYSQDYLKWKIIEWGHNNKFRYYDLTGANPDSTDKKELGIFNYKKKWGGKLIYYNQILL